MDRRELVIRQLEAALTLLQTALGVLLEESHGEIACEHPEAERKQLTMGDNPAWECGKCGYVHNPQGESEA